MKILKNKNAITLLALVITIIIMLLLAGVAIQMTIGENGLIAKSTQAKTEQVKADLYSTAKLEYLNLKTKAIENNQPEPAVESVLSESSFLNKYNIIGNNITNKNNEFIETKENLITELKKTSTSSDTTTVSEVDKDKLIIRVNVKEATTLFVSCHWGVHQMLGELPDGSTKNVYYHPNHIPTIVENYSPGSYILKFSGTTPEYLDGITFETDNTKASIDIINWGKEHTNETRVSIEAVDKILRPEPDLYIVDYKKAVFNKIPEYLFSKKITNTQMSKFSECNNLDEIPEDLFKNCINVEYFNSTFYSCKNITSIPENLFKYNTKVKQFNYTFWYYKGDSIPENLFKYNVEAQSFMGTFYNSNIKNIPENLFINNYNINSLYMTFGNCRELLYIPQSVINKALSALDHSFTFKDCSSSSNYNSIPAELK